MLIKTVVFTLLSIITLPAYASCPQSDDRPLDSITFDFRVASPPFNRDVACSSRDKGKHCNCSCSTCPSLAGDNRPIFTMQRSYDGTFGVLNASSGGVTIPIMCRVLNGGARTPNLTMIRQWIGDDTMITNCTFSTRAKYADELLDQKQTSQAQAKTATGSNEQSSLNLKDNDRRIIVEALQQSSGDTVQAAKKLGISERALLRKMKEYRLDATAR